MTPMVDVVMVILIFFMASSALVGHELLMRARVAPEQGELSTQPLISPAALTVRMEARANDIRVTGLGLREVSTDAIIERIRARATDLKEGQIPVVVWPQEGVPYQRVVDVVSALDAAGVKDVAIR